MEDIKSHRSQIKKETHLAVMTVIYINQVIRQVRNEEAVLLVSEDAADLESVELVANEVLAMHMPTTPAQLQNLTEEIRQKVAELGGVETILQQSAGDIKRAENLLDQARQAR